MKRNCLLQANQRVEEFKMQLKELKVKLKTAEKRAIFAEKTVKIFTKEMDKREGDKHIIYVFYYYALYMRNIRYIIIRVLYMQVSASFQFFKFVKY